MPLLQYVVPDQFLTVLLSGLAASWWLSIFKSSYGQLAFGSKKAISSKTSPWYGFSIMAQEVCACFKGRSQPFHLQCIKYGSIKQSSAINLKSSCARVSVVGVGHGSSSMPPPYSLLEWLGVSWRDTALHKLRERCAC